MKDNSEAFAASLQGDTTPITTPRSVSIKALQPAKSLAEHEIKLTGAFNVRDLGGFQTKNGLHIKPKMLLRSARLNMLTEHDAKILVNQYHVGFDFDLRRPEEVQAQPDVRVPEITYINDSVETADSFRYEITPENNRQHYRSYVTTQKARDTYHHLFMTLLNAKGKAVLWHCAAGKDRTGFGGALIMYVLGVDMETIFDDYDASNDFLRAHNERQLNFMKENGFSEAEIETAKIDGEVDRSYLAAAFDEINRQYGSISRFISKGLRISPRQQKKLRKLYLE